MTYSYRNGQSFAAGSAIGALSGLIGLGGAEFRLPVLVGLFRLNTLEAIIVNKAMSLVVVAAALLLRGGTISFDSLFGHSDIVLNLLAGSLAGAWFAAGRALQIPSRRLDLIVMILLLGLALLMLTESWLGLHKPSSPLIYQATPRFLAGLTAGFAIGAVAALIGVAGGELLIPTIVLLYGLDIKMAGSLSLFVSLPTMLVGLIRYRNSDSFAVLHREKRLFLWMTAGSLLGAGLGAMMLGVVPAHRLIELLGIVLLISAVKTFKHVRITAPEARNAIER
ncbi:MAG: sulfite exporter TauE/SafE family protein [Methylomicrobium sp.]|nr:sulfite exporter TauE/SafE family protein [Methylomicrobium sp.]